MSEETTKPAETDVPDALEGDAAIEDAAIEDASVEDAAVEDAAVEDAAVEDAAVEDAAVEDAAVEDGAVEDGAIEVVAVETPPPAPAPRPTGRPVRGSRAAAIATGRRKTSVARVRLYEGTGSFLLNGRSLEDYFPELSYRLKIAEPFRAVSIEGRYDVHAKLEGGGLTGQTDALVLGIARALSAINPEFRPILKRAGFLTRDPREVERKKYGLRKARRAPQYTKR